MMKINHSNQVADHKYSNRLNNESSPYLLAHAHNPVDWYPWGGEAIEKAKRENKPIFLSIGYAACHWCHVMERESFENEEIASILNEHYVSIKVDREERPDIDHIYMQATMAMTGTGGWPLSIFLTPDLKPFFAGTYFPPENMRGIPGFKYLISELAEGYKAEHDHIAEVAEKIADTLKSRQIDRSEKGALDRSVIERAYRALMNNFDSVSGGFGGAPKFPHPNELSFLIQWHAMTGNKQALAAANRTLQAMARGGIYDQIGGGFHRYSTDGRWLVPHFEKMLYDNALLVMAYCDAFTITKNEEYRRIVKETLDFILREMTDSEGGFYSSLDADSEGEEGKYYLWKKREVASLLGENSEYFCKYYNISEYGNFEGGDNIPNIDSESQRYRENFAATSAEFDRKIGECRKILFNARSKRNAPGRDDKILTSWNGLAISAFCRGYQITGDIRYRTAAIAAADFILKFMLRGAQLSHSFRKEIISKGQFLEDYAYFSAGLIDLYETDCNHKWIELAAKLASESIILFSDDEGKLYLTPANQSDHLIRPREKYDSALPTPGSVLIQVLIKSAAILGNDNFKEQAEKFLRALSDLLLRMPEALISAVRALIQHLEERIDLVVVGTDNQEVLLKVIYNNYLLNRIIVASDTGGELLPLLEGKKSRGRARAYICKNNVCLPPVDDPEELSKIIMDLGPVSE